MIKIQVIWRRKVKCKHPSLIQEIMDFIDVENGEWSNYLLRWSVDLTIEWHHLGNPSSTEKIKKSFTVDSYSNTFTTARIPGDDRHAMALIRCPLASRWHDTGLNPLNA